MGLYKTSIISGANEESFIDDFVSAVLSAGAGHVTGGVVSPGFNPDEGESNTPVIEFTIDSVAKLTLTRPAEVKKTNGVVSSSTAINNYNVSITHVPTGQSISTTGFMSTNRFRFRTQTTYMGQAVRHWKLAVISNAKVFILQLGTFDQSAVDYNPFAQISVLADGTTKIVRGKIRNGSTYSQDTGYLLTDGTALTMVDRQALVYDEQNANHIGVIKNKLFKRTSDNVHVLTTNALYDSSNFDINNRQIIIGGKKCYVVSPNTVLPF